MTLPLTPQTSIEGLNDNREPQQPQFHYYLRAKYPYHPPYDCTLSTVNLPLNVGDIVLIHSVHVNGWADGTLLNSGLRGWLPTNYCEPYDHAPMRNLMKALTVFWDVVRGSDHGITAPFYNQDYTRGLIAGTRCLLV